MEVYLIRHTTPALTPGLIYGRSDILLADTFEQEWESLKDQLPAEFDTIYSSPAIRCTSLAQRINKDYVTDHRLTELDFGTWEGKTWDTVDQTELKVWMDDFVHVCVPGGESMVQMLERVRSFWEELALMSDHKIAIVTHAGVIRLILSVVRNLPLKNLFQIKVNYGEVIVEEVG